MRLACDLPPCGFSRLQVIVHCPRLLVVVSCLYLNQPKETAAVMLLCKTVQSLPHCNGLFRSICGHVCDLYFVVGQKKLGKVITPDPWKAGARNTTGFNAEMHFDKNILLSCSCFGVLWGATHCQITKHILLERHYSIVAETRLSYSFA